MRIILLDGKDVVWNIIEAEPEFPETLGWRWARGDRYPDAAIGKPLPEPKDDTEIPGEEAEEVTEESPGDKTGIDTESPGDKTETAGSLPAAEGGESPESEARGPEAGTESPENGAEDGELEEELW